jgi:hypothetical protein
VSARHEGIVQDLDAHMTPVLKDRHSRIRLIL